MSVKQFKLIDGTFEPDEANNILFNLVNTKINFHAMEAFGISIRTSGDTSFHEKRIKELTSMHHDLKLLMEQAQAQGLHVQLSGVITVSLLPGNDAP